MPELQIPKTIKWLIIALAALFIGMQVYRVAIHILFHDVDTSRQNLLQIFIAGARLDARVCGGLGLLLLLVSYLPGLHFFKHHSGKQAGIVLMLLAAAGVLLLYGFDFITLLKHSSRINGLLTRDDVPVSSGSSIKPINLITLMGVGLVLLYFFYLFIRFVYRQIAIRSTGTDEKMSRSIWHILFILLCGMALWGTLLHYPLSTGNMATWLPDNGVFLAANPVELVIAGIFK